MSFIVKGKKIPNTCWDCPLADVEQGWCDSDMVTIIDFNERPVECPLVALPEKHGELIDRNGLLRDIEHYHLSDGKFQHWVEVQNTIVEAEDEP